MMPNIMIDELYIPEGYTPEEWHDYQAGILKMLLSRQMFENQLTDCDDVIE